MFSHFLRKLGSLIRTGSSTRTLRLSGRTWHLAPNAMAAFGPGGPDLDRWIADGSARIVKTGPHRTVYRVTLPAGVVYVKHCRIMGPRAWAREVVRPPKACLEFENLLTLQQRGIAAVSPLAWGRADSPLPGESFLITRALEGAIPFTEYVERGLCFRERRELATALGRFFAKLHDSGVSHPDPHPGNLLVEHTGTGPRFTLLDLHAVSIGRPLSQRAREANLVLFNRWFQLRATRTDRLRFLKAYEPRPLLARRAQGIERATVRSNRAFWASRVTRCTGTNRYFTRITRGSLHGFALRDLPEDVLAPLLVEPDALFGSAENVLKDSRTSTVVIVSLGGTPYVLKRVNVRHWSEPFKNLFRPSAVLRSWINGHALRDRWLPTPRPLVMLHRKRRGLPAEGYLLMELVPDVQPLSESCSALARVLRQMHDRGVSHRDLKASNILLQRGSNPVLIDLVGVRLGFPPAFSRRCRELARLAASFLHVRHSVRLRFLRVYLAAGDPMHGDWRSWWIEISRAVAAKREKNRKSGRPLA